MKWRTRDFWRQRDGLWMIRNKHSEWNSSATRPDASCAEAETDKGGNCDHRLIISAGQKTANINFMNLVFQKYNDDVHSRHHCRMATKTKTDFDSGGINVDMYEWLNTQTERRTGCMHSSLDGWMEARRPARMNEGVNLPWSETSTIPHNNYGLTPTAGSVLIRPAFRANTHHKDINMPWLKATSLRP